MKKEAEVKVEMQIGRYEMRFSLEDLERILGDYFNEKNRMKKKYLRNNGKEGDIKFIMQIGDKRMTFFPKDLKSILEKVFCVDNTPQKEKEDIQISVQPTEGIPFEVNPLKIDINLFNEERNDNEQEYVRKMIVHAFTCVFNYPSRYGRPFKTLRPEKKWDVITLNEMRNVASTLGDHMADLTEQALEWAQRIANGETWEDVCNKADTSNWFRVVNAYDGYAWVFGGSTKAKCFESASCTECEDYAIDERILYAVPLVVLY